MTSAQFSYGVFYPPCRMSLSISPRRRGERPSGRVRILTLRHTRAGQGEGGERNFEGGKFFKVALRLFRKGSKLGGRKAQLRFQPLSLESFWQASGLLPRPGQQGSSGLSFSSPLFLLLLLLLLPALSVSFGLRLITREKQTQPTFLWEAPSIERKSQNGP